MSDAVITGFHPRLVTSTGAAVARPSHGATARTFPAELGPGTCSVWDLGHRPAEITFSRVGRAPRPSVARMSPQQIASALVVDAGLTADDIATALGVSRRTIQAWKSGARPSDERERRLREVSDVVLAFAANGGTDGLTKALRAPHQGESLLRLLGRGLAPQQLWRQLAERTGILPDAPTLPIRSAVPPDAPLEDLSVPGATGPPLRAIFVGE